MNAQPPEENSPAQVEKDHKFNDFFDKYWQADEKGQAEMDKQMDKVFSDYFDDSDSDSHPRTTEIFSGDRRKKRFTCPER